jgi:uncharacterized membrane protein (UPF0136 family)
VELVGDGDDDGIDAAVRQHLAIVGVGDLRLVNHRHPVQQVLGGGVNSVPNSEIPTGIVRKA